MCRQIVELHGGAIACDAGIGGVGTRITVTLPAPTRDPAVVNDLAAYVTR
jgi:signal transduction histidine kinase